MWNIRQPGGARVHKSLRELNPRSMTCGALPLQILQVFQVASNEVTSQMRPRDIGSVSTTMKEPKNIIPKTSVLFTPSTTASLIAGGSIPRRKNIHLKKAESSSFRRDSGESSLPLKCSCMKCRRVCNADLLTQSKYQARIKTLCQRSKESRASQVNSVPAWKSARFPTRLSHCTNGQRNKSPLCYLPGDWVRDLSESTWVILVIHVTLTVQNLGHRYLSEKTRCWALGSGSSVLFRSGTASTTLASCETTSGSLARQTARHQQKRYSCPLMETSYLYLEDSRKKHADYEIVTRVATSSLFTEHW